MHLYEDSRIEQFPKAIRLRLDRGTSYPRNGYNSLIQIPKGQIILETFSEKKLKYKIEILILFRKILDFFDTFNESLKYSVRDFRHIQKKLK